MKKIICLILMVLLLPFSFGCETGLQGKVTISITYLDGTSTTISGHRKYGEEGEEDSIFYKLSNSINYSTEQVGKSVVYKYKDTNNIFSSDDVYKLNNGASINIIESLQNKKYQVYYYSTFPELNDTNSYTKTYDFGEKIEYIDEIKNLINYDNSITNFDRYTFSGWEIQYTDEFDNTIGYPIEFGETFNEKYVNYFETAKVLPQYSYNYQMEIKAVFKPNTYTAVLHFQHEGVKPLNTYIEAVKIELPFNQTYFSEYDFTKYVKEENIKFFGFSTDKFTSDSLPNQIDKWLDGTEIHLYARWSRFKMLTIDFLDGSGPIKTYVFDDEFASTYYLYPTILAKHLTSAQIKGLVGFSENRDGTSRIIDLYEIGDENTIYYPVIL